MKCMIDGREIEVEPGTSIILAAQRLGIRIPHFCWHPDLSVDGNCRMCVVEIEGSSKPQTACSTMVTDGMVVHTDSPQVRKARRATLELLLVNHPIDCPVCDQAGECYLQDQYMEHGLHDARISLDEKVRKRKVVDLGPIVLDAERCVLCSRCIRFEREVTGTNQLGFVGRGDHTEIAAFDNRPISHNYAGNLADVCPVGALLSRDFRFRMRVWFLESTPSVCPGCSTGCNIFIDHRDGEIHRLRPRRNVSVNRSWMCDLGRALYKGAGAPSRLLGARLRSEDDRGMIPVGEALDLLSSRLRDAGEDVAFLASPQATNEDLFAFQSLCDAVSGMLDFRVDDPQDRMAVLEDGVLLRADRNPNTRGCLELGLGRTGVDAIMSACRAGRVKALLLQGPELLRTPAAGIFLEKVPFVAVMAENDEPALARAHLVLPAAAWTENEGTFVNFARRVQRIERAIEPPGESRPRWRLASDLLARLSRPLDATTAWDVFRLASRSTAAFSGLEHVSIGESGLDLDAIKES
ncbi:MAG: (2Fe-2S)-binding protein [Vicinamibacteria bacterium]|nr:(2Fe-2S)-binding protein [Vicinamibacteria bacterium]